MHFLSRLAGGTAAVAAALGAVSLALPTAHYPAEPDAGTGLVTAVPAATFQGLATIAELTWDEGIEVRVATGASGVITSLDVRSGDDVACGDVIMHLNGEPLVAFCAPFPLWRPVDAATIGPDRLAVDEFLDATGASPARVDGVVDPIRTIWLRGPLTVDSVDVEVGDLLVGGDVVLRVDPSLHSAQLRIAPHLGTRAVFAPDVTPAQLQVDADGRITDLDALVAITRGQPDQAPTELTGRLIESLPDGAVTVPIGALIDGPTQDCVVTDDGDIRPVDILVAEAGGATVIGEITPGDRVRLQTGSASCSG